MTDASPTKTVSRKAIVSVSLAVLAAVIGAVWIAAPKASESTEAAYIQADSSVVAPRVRGLVAQVLVAHNQPVRKGDPLVLIDAEEFDARLAAAQADLSSAEAAVAAARAALTALDAETRLAASSVRAAEAADRAAQAHSQLADRDAGRYEALVSSGAVARRDVDAYGTASATARSEADRTRALVDVSRDQAGVVAAKRASLLAGEAQALGALSRAQAALTLARQDQGHATIRAPIDGVVADRQVEPGDYVQPGTRLLTIEPLGRLYVTANFKETQTARMVPGQPVRIKIDALGGKALNGHVESLAPGTGSRFALLPFEPGTGNFTKIVQRVPVRIAFDPGQADLARLRPGLSVEPTVQLRN
jgi:membrane fusion protein (multidrug efflux system)